MPIDLEGLAIIDTMLDTIVELRLMGGLWNETQEEDLSAVHESLLHLNRLWEDLDDSPDLLHASFELRTPMNSILGFTKVLKAGLDGAIPDASLPYLNNLETLAELVLRKMNYYIDKYKIKTRD